MQGETAASKRPLFKFKKQQNTVFLSYAGTFSMLVASKPFEELFFVATEPTKTKYDFFFLKVNQVVFE